MGLFFTWNGGNSVTKFPSKNLKNLARCFEQTAKYMNFHTADDFCKRQVCPSAENLLGYYRLELPSNSMQRVAAHLSKCEFCNAELQLLQTFSSLEAETKITETEMPPALRQLAETLLGNRQNEFRLLRKLFNDKELSVSITK